jgi:hypothetical protein
LIDILPDLPVTLKDDPVKLTVNAEPLLLPTVNVLSTEEFQTLPFQVKVIPPEVNVSSTLGLSGKFIAILGF